MLDGLVGSYIDEEGVDLDHLAGLGGPQPLGETLGVALQGSAAGASGVRVAAQRGDRGDDTPVHELAQDAAGHRDRDDAALAAQQGSDLALAPHRVVGAQVLHGLGERGRPGGLAAMVWCPALGLGVLLPAVEGGAADTDGAGRLPGREAVGHGTAPASNGITPSLRFDMWGLRSEKARRHPGVSDKL